MSVFKWSCSSNTFSHISLIVKEEKQTLGASFWTNDLQLHYFYCVCFLFYQSALVVYHFLIFLFRLKLECLSLEAFSPSLTSAPNPQKVLQARARLRHRHSLSLYNMSGRFCVKFKTAVIQILFRMNPQNILAKVCSA